ncbi:MAG: hypothetical protein MZW92_65390 [Comamonadaceae bacterium]|nr:hypothetical protein [Comamonadaceae bacterium]
MPVARAFLARLPERLSETSDCNRSPVKRPCAMKPGEPTPSPEADGVPRVKPLHGRGAVGNPDSRFADWTRQAFDDGWDHGQDEPDSPATELIADHSKSIICRNDSPDVPFEQSINPYRGCEHGCAYCFARPSHAYLGFSPGLDFETRILYKPDAAALLRSELGATGLPGQADRARHQHRRLPARRAAAENHAQLAGGTGRPAAIRFPSSPSRR